MPVRVDYLSRARTTKETREVLDALKEGKIDILIGTHKLISKTVNGMTWDCSSSMKSRSSVCLPKRNSVSSR